MPQSEKSLARLAAVQVLFEVEATRRHYNEVLVEILDRDPAALLDIEADKDGEENISINQNLARQIVNDAVFHQIKIDQNVNAILMEGWKLKAVDPTLRAIFRAATAEIIRAKAPYKVVINEYLDITRAFDERKSTISFVNAVIDGTRKALATD